MSDYVIEGGAEGKARLNILGQVMNEYSIATLHKAGIAPGHICLDAGCGGGTMTYAIARLVGTGGRVTGIDFDGGIIALNEEERKNSSLNNILFRQQNIYKLQEHDVYDMVFTRYLLSHLDNPALALANMVQALKPGGILVAEDIQFSGHVCYPQNDAFDTYLQWYSMAVRLNGGDAESGPSLHALLAGAGLYDVQVSIAQPIATKGPAKQMGLLTLDKIKQAVLDNNIATGEEFDHVRSRLAAITADDATLISIPRTFQVWGRKSR